MYRIINKPEDTLGDASFHCRWLLSATPPGIFIVDLESVVSLWSPAAETMFGWTEEELRGRKIPIIPQDKQHEFRQLLHRTAMGEKPTEVDLSISRKNGEMIDASLLASPLRDAQGNTAAIMVVCTEITERRTMENYFHRVQSMESTARLVEGIAHDFNNFLTAIIFLSEFLLKDFKDPAHSRKLEQILMLSEDAACLTRQLFLFGHLNVSSLEMLDLNTIIQSRGGILGRVLGEDIQVVIVKDPDLYLVEATRGQLEQVIMNLMINARDAMPQGGKLTLKTENVPDGRTDTSGSPFICLSVSDTGVGIEPQVFPKIFQPFFTTKTLEKGTGLGLSTVNEIVRNLGGWIEVDSEVNKGSTFRVYLPAQVKTADKADARHDLHARENLQGQGERILVVEDHPEVLGAFAESLQENGYNVSKAVTASEAMQIFEKEKGVFQLIFTDVVLSDSSGLKLAEHLVSRQPELRVLLCSGYCDEKSQYPFIQEKKYHFLPKPFKTNDLLRTVQQILQ